MNDELKHYGVLGMKWGQRRSRVISVRGKPMIVTGNNRFNRTINKNPSKEEIQNIKNPISSKTRAATKRGLDKILDNKVFKALVFDRNDVTGLIFKKSEVQKLKDFFSKKHQDLSDGFNRWQIKANDKEIKKLRQTAKELRASSKNEKILKKAKEFEELAQLYEDDINTLYSPEELNKYRGE